MRCRAALLTVVLGVAACGSGGETAVPATLPDLETTTTVAPTTTRPADPRAAACVDVVAAVPREAGDPLPFAPIDGMRVGLVPELPLSGPPLLVRFAEYDSARDFLNANGAIVDIPGRLEAMDRLEFVRGAEATYSGGPDRFELQMLEFPSTEAALEYQEIHLRAACGSGMFDARPIEGVPGGVSIITVEDSGLVSVSVILVIDDTEITAGLCTCLPADDPFASSEDWARRFVGVIRSAQI